MRSVLLACLLGLSIACDLAMFIASSDDAPESFNPLHPTTLVPIMENRLHTLRCQVAELDMRHFLDVLAAPYRERLEHEGPTSAPGR
jgi:hypothetical protein